MTDILDLDALEALIPNVSYDADGSTGIIHCRTPRCIEALVAIVNAAPALIALARRAETAEEFYQARTLKAEARLAEVEREKDKLQHDLIEQARLQAGLATPTFENLSTREAMRSACITELGAERDAARAEVAQLTRDADYWSRVALLIRNHAAIGMWNGQWQVECFGSAFTGSTLEAAIDAAFSIAEIRNG